jgi:hypothetical protein
MTEIAAWWGAVIATLSLGWNVYKWIYQGPKLRISGNANMKISSDPEEGLFIFVEVSNVGDRSTTLTSFIGYIYPNKISVVLKKPSRRYVFPSPPHSIPLPYTLEPGHRWTGVIFQKQLEANDGKETLIYCGVCDSSKKRPSMARIKL